MCPVVELCTTRGELAAGAKAARQKKREIHYALDYRNLDNRNRDGDDGGLVGEVLLVQRARDASLMAGMWELPELADGHAAFELSFTLRHSITVTDYTVRVWRAAAPESVAGKWIPATRLARVALTGLARKILRKAELL
jgi:A/G-specific adenine glycosylase